MEDGVVPKAIISNKIYIEVPDSATQKSITDQLTYAIEKKTFTKMGSGKLNPKKQVEFIRHYTVVKAGILAIPQGRVDLIPIDYEIVDKRVFNEVPFPNPVYPLRNSQLEVFNSVEDSCFINAKVGWGKTFTALHLARKLGQKTLIVTHTVALKTQWIEEATKLFNMPIGQIGGGIFDIEDHAIVVANIQSLVKYKLEISKEFGTIIMDEAHHAPASTFTEIIDTSYARYRIGLSGTMQRKDGRHALLTDFFSNNVYTPAVDNTLPPKVNILTPGVYLDAGLPWAQKINNLLYDEDYQQFIARLVRILQDRGHSVLFLASRTEFLKKVKEYVGDSCVLVTGETSYEDRAKIAQQIDSGEKTSIAGSRQIFSEGISINRLSAVILAEPMTFDGLLEQIIGRVRRMHDNKLYPEVFDVNFSDRASQSQNKARLGFYMKSGWEIQAHKI